MRPYKIFTKTLNFVKKNKIISPIKKIKIPLYFCKKVNLVSKAEIVLPDTEHH